MSFTLADLIGGPILNNKILNGLAIVYLNTTPEHCSIYEGQIKEISEDKSGNQLKIVFSWLCYCDGKGEWHPEKTIQEITFPNWKDMPGESKEGNHYSSETEEFHLSIWQPDQEIDTDWFKLKSKFAN